jgi:hypothetical protein
MELKRITEVRRPSRWPAYVHLPVALAMLGALVSAFFSYGLMSGDLVWKSVDAAPRAQSQREEMLDRMVVEAREKNAVLENQLHELFDLAGSRRAAQELSDCDRHFGFSDSNEGMYGICLTESVWYKKHPFDPQSIVFRVLDRMPEH